MEIWKDVKNYEGNYKVSSIGRFKTLKRYGTLETKILKKQNNSTGFLVVRFSKNGKPKMHNCHRVIAEHFIDNPESLPLVKFRDGNKKNLSSSNLYWAEHGSGKAEKYPNDKIVTTKKPRFCFTCSKVMPEKYKARRIVMFPKKAKEMGIKIKAPLHIYFCQCCAKDFSW